MIISLSTIRNQSMLLEDNWPSIWPITVNGINGIRMIGFEMERVLLSLFMLLPLFWIRLPLRWLNCMYRERLFNCWIRNRIQHIHFWFDLFANVIIRIRIGIQIFQWPLWTLYWHFTTIKEERSIFDISCTLRNSAFLILI